MLKAHWSGYEIDSSEAAYEVAVSKPEELGTLVRALLGSGYFTRSRYLVFEDPILRLRDHIIAHGHRDDKLTAKTLKCLERLIARFNPRRYVTINVRTIEALLNYVGIYREELLEHEVFHFEPTEEQREIYEEYEYKFESGGKVDETMFYSENEIPLDGVVLYLGCYLEKLSQIPPEDQSKAREIASEILKEIGLPIFETFLNGRRDYLKEQYDRPKPLSLRVRINPDATFLITGRWFDDGQFDFPYYQFFLQRAASKAKAKIKFHMIY
jgi:hypothetical protein